MAGQGGMTETRDGQDFASAAMMRLVAAGLARQGIAPPPPPTGARVPQTAKRRVLEGVLMAHGPLAILRIADAAAHMPPEPLVQALRQARDAADLLDRWQRLERFSHARHSVQVDTVAPDTFRLTHWARDAGPAPSQAESLLVLAVLAILCEGITARGVALTTPDGVPLRQGGAWCAADLPDPLGPVFLREAAGKALTLPPVAEADPIRARLAADPLRRWTLAGLARDLGTSPRSLQRRLAEQGQGFSRLLVETRLQVAARLLGTAQGPSLAEIGFLAGFSDQAHFSRLFQRHVGTTPSRYRADFGR